MDQITIAGHTFNVPVPFAEGHVCTAGQAAALNQTYHENIRNNCAKKVNDSKSEDGSVNLPELQAYVDKYAAEYEFGVRRTGVRGPTDPIEREALEIIKNLVKAKIAEKGMTATTTEIKEFAMKVLGDEEKSKKYRDMARKRIAELQKVGVQLDDLLDAAE